MITTINEWKLYTESINVMSLTIPSEQKWVVKMTSNSETIYGFEYLHKMYFIQPAKLQWFKDNVGKQIQFKVNSESKINYMMLPSLQKQYESTDLDDYNLDDYELEDVMPHRVELQNGIDYKSINFNDLNVEMSGSEVKIQIPGEGSFNKGIKCHLTDVNGLNLIELTIDENLRGLGLGYKIYMKLIKEYGNVYSKHDKRVNDDGRINNIWTKLDKEQTINVLRNNVGWLAIDINNTENDKIIEIFNKID